MYMCAVVCIHITLHYRTLCNNQRMTSLCMSTNVLWYMYIIVMHMCFHTCVIVYISNITCSYVERYMYMCKESYNTCSSIKIGFLKSIDTCTCSLANTCMYIYFSFHLKMSRTWPRSLPRLPWSCTTVLSETSPPPPQSSTTSSTSGTCLESTTGSSSSPLIALIPLRASSACGGTSASGCSMTA